MRQSVLNSPSTKLEIEKAMQAKLVAEALSGSDANKHQSHTLKDFKGVGAQGYNTKNNN